MVSANVPWRHAKCQCIPALIHGCGGKCPHRMRASFDQLQQVQQTSAPQGQTQQSQSTSALLSTLQPLQPSKPKQQQIVKSAPDPTKARTAAMPPPPAAVKSVPYAIGQKGRQPTGPPPKVPPVKNLPTAPPAQSATGAPQGLIAVPQPDELPANRFTRQHSCLHLHRQRGHQLLSQGRAL